MSRQSKRATTTPSPEPIMSAGAWSWQGRIPLAVSRRVAIAPRRDPDHGTDFAPGLCCNSSNILQFLVANRPSRGNTRGKTMSGYSILILICSTALSHSDCQAKTALDVVRGPSVDNSIMCALNAQTMIARTDLVQGDGAQYMKVVCTPSKNADEWMAEVEARKAALQ